MKILIADNDINAVAALKENLEKISARSNITSVDTSLELRSLIKKNRFDVLFIETVFDDEKGIDIVKEVKEKLPRINIIFVSADMSYKADALDLKVSGYIVKPVDYEVLKKEMKELRYEVKEEGALLKVQCFGNFTVFTTNGKLVKFSRSKEKELFAYLIYKRGTAVTTKELAAVLFEDDSYDTKKQGYLQQLFHSLIKDLRAVSADEVVKRDYNSTSVDISLVDCDYFRFGNNEAIAKRLYAGEFMMQYEWADYVASYLDRKVND